VRLFSRRVDDETREAFQPRLWLTVGALALIVAYVVAFVVENDATVDVHFVFLTAHTSVIWLILLSVVIGVVVGLLLSQLERRRGWLARRRQEPG
jgi:uncharacterized integral membrane protein